MALRVSLRAKLLSAFAVVLAPVLVLLLLAYRDARDAQRRHALEAQLLTAQAVAVQIDEAFEAAIRMGRAVASNPLVRTMDPAVLDPLLRKLVEETPQYDTINVFDATGENRGWGHLSEPAAPRLQIGDRAYFRRAMSQNIPTISDVLDLRRPNQLGFVVSVPIHDEAGRPMGVVNVVARTDMLAHAYTVAQRQPGQSILLTDATARLAFVTNRPSLRADDSYAMQGFEPVRRALQGSVEQVADYQSPVFDERRMGAFVPTARHGWVVGVTIPLTVALASARESFQNQLVGWFAILCFSIAVALLLVRYLAGPVRRLEAHAQALGGGQLSRRVRIRTADELERLGIAFNDMAERLEQREAELKRAQAGLVRNERLAAVGELAAVVAHEVRNPVGVIFNAVAALRRHPPASEAEGRLVEILEEEADRLNRIVGDLLDFARPLAPSSEPTDVLQLVREAVCSAVPEDVPVQVEASYEEGLPQVSLDPRMVRQVVVNLAINAAQAMPGGGVLHVRVCGERDADGDAIRIELRDEGVGMRPEVLARIFEPFFTTKATGTGLGLAVVKRIVEAHAGEIACESSEGQGTTFIVRLPVEPQRRPLPKYSGAPPSLAG